MHDANYKQSKVFDPLKNSPVSLFYSSIHALLLLLLGEEQVAEEEVKARQLEESKS